MRNDRKLIFPLSDASKRNSSRLPKHAAALFLLIFLFLQPPTHFWSTGIADARWGDVSDPNTSFFVGFFRARSHEHMFKLGGKLEDLRNHLLSKAFGKHTKMIFGYCSPQVGMAGAARGPSGPGRKGREPGELKSAVISFSFITLEFSRLERKVDDSSKESGDGSFFQAGQSLMTL